MYIKTLKMEHKCSEFNGKVYHCNAPFIAKGYLDGFIADKKWSREGIQSTVRRDYGMQVGYQMCYSLIGQGRWLLRWLKALWKTSTTY